MVWLLSIQLKRMDKMDKNMENGQKPTEEEFPFIIHMNTIHKELKIAQMKKNRPWFILRFISGVWSHDDLLQSPDHDALKKILKNR